MKVEEIEDREHKMDFSYKVEIINVDVTCCDLIETESNYYPPKLYSLPPCLPLISCPSFIITIFFNYFEWLSSLVFEI